MTTDIDVYIQETLQRYPNLSQQFIALLEDSYATGPMSTVVGNLESGAPQYSFAPPSNNFTELVINSGSLSEETTSQQLADVYISANSDSYGFSSTAGGQYLNSTSTYSIAIDDITNALGETLTDEELSALMEPANRLGSVALIDESTATTLVPIN